MKRLLRAFSLMYYDKCYYTEREPQKRFESLSNSNLFTNERNHVAFIARSGKISKVKEFKTAYARMYM